MSSVCTEISSHEILSNAQHTAVHHEHQVAAVRGYVPRGTADITTNITHLLYLHSTPPRCHAEQRTSQLTQPHLLYLHSTPPPPLSPQPSELPRTYQYLDKKLEAHLKLDWYNEQAVKSEARRQANQPVSLRPHLYPKLSDRPRTPQHSLLRLTM